MQKKSIPENEEQRLEVLYAHKLLDTANESDFDDLVFLASVFCETPIALFSLVDKERQWFKAKIGLEATETPRDISFCSHAILQSNPFVIPDASADDRFRDNPLVKAGPHIRFYAGVPIQDNSGMNLGTLCVIDHVPRNLKPDQLRALSALGRQIISRLELRQARHALIDHSRLKSELFANMSHELRTPLNGIVGAASLLVDTELGPDQRQFAQVIQESGELLLGAVNDLLDFSKIESGLMQIANTTFNFASLLEELGRAWTANAQKKRLRFSVQLSPEVPQFLTGDSQKIRQVLAHLLSNALKFTQKGEVRLVVDIIAGQLRIQISDTGIGIPLSSQSRIFEMFTQVDSSSTRKYGGTGLGLCICKRLVELMGGQINVESTVGEGAKFSVVLPLLS